MIVRNVTKSLTEDLSYFPAIGIIGPRQVGKTTLAKYLQTQLSTDSIYLDLELPSDKRLLTDAEQFLRFHQNKCVVIDEIQRMPALFELLRALIDMDSRPARFIILGSASPTVIKGSSETLAGRVAYTELTPFSRNETISQFDLTQHWLWGGFPKALLAPNAILASRWIGSFITTFIERDLIELGTQVTTPLVRKLLEMIGYLHGNILNVSDLSRSLGVSQPTINRYLDLLEGAFMIERLQPYFTNTSKRIVKSPKIYIRDSGILHYLSNIRSYEQLLSNPLVGASWEGYVIEQIRRATNSDWQHYYYRTQKGAESDLFLISPSGNKICIEIKLSLNPTISRGFYETLADLKPDHRFVIIPTGQSYPKSDDVWVMNLDEFLQTQLPTF